MAVPNFEQKRGKNPAVQKTKHKKEKDLEKNTLAEKAPKTRTATEKMN